MKLRQKFINYKENLTVNGPYEYNEMLTGIYYKNITTGMGNDISKFKGEANEVSKTLIMVVCDEDGDEVFKPSDLDFLNELPIKLTTQMVKDAMKASNLNVTQEERLKNSEATTQK